MKTTTTTVRDALRAKGIAIAKVAKAIKVSPRTLGRMLDGDLADFGGAAKRAALEDFLKANGIEGNWPSVVGKENAPAVAAAEANPELLPSSSPTEERECLSMLLRKQSISPGAMRKWRISRSPFSGDLSADAVFTGGDYHYYLAALKDVAAHGGFMALTGESGAGKTTLLETLRETEAVQGRALVLIEPYVLAMEANDNKGKTLKSSTIAESVIRTLAPSATIRLTQDARFNQMQKLLKDSAAAGNNHVLVIEEAHSLPIPTIKHLKRFLEVKDGRRSLIGIVLLGQPELAEILNERNGEVREVVQRCEVFTIAPLDGDLEAYLRHRFKVVGIDSNTVFDKTAYPAIKARLTSHTAQGSKAQVRSICYPLVVNNLVARAMNQAAELGFDKVTEEVITGC